MRLLGSSWKERDLLLRKITGKRETATLVKVISWGRKSDIANIYFRSDGISTIYSRIIFNINLRSILVTGTLLGLSLLALSSKKAVAALIIIIGLIRINIDYSWPSDTITLEGRANPLC